MDILQLSLMRDRMNVLHTPRAGENKVFIAVPSYGPVEGTFAYSLAVASQELERRGIIAEICFVLGCCHVDDARNALAHKFIDTDCGHLVFIDADISFEFDQLLKLIQTPGDLVGGTYPFKRDKPEGYPIQIFGEAFENDDGLVQVSGLPTGFMKISRKVFEDIEKQCKSYFTHDKLKPTIEYFNRTIAGTARVGGDINFCHKWNRTGGKTYLIPDLDLNHTGTKTWRGNFHTYQYCKELGTAEALLMFMKQGKHTRENISKFLDYWGNPYSAPVAFQAAAVALSRETKGPTLELGSGASTAILGTLMDNDVWTVEHDPEWYERICKFCEDHDLKHNIHLVDIDEKGEYEIPEHFPKSWGLVLVDGPPRQIGDRQDAAKIEADVFLIDDCEGQKTQDLIRKLGGTFSALDLGLRTVGVVKRG